MDQKTPALVLRSKLIVRAMVPSLIVNSIFVGFIGTGFIGIVGLNLIDKLKLNMSPIPMFVGIFIFLVMFIPAYNYVARRINYANTEFRFFEHHMEYFEGFMTIENKSIPYDKITETTMEKGLIQKRFGLGTITLATSTTPNSKDNKAGIVIPDVEDVENKYTLVKNLVGKK